MVTLKNESPVPLDEAIVEHVVFTHDEVSYRFWQDPENGQLIVATREDFGTPEYERLYEKLRRRWGGADDGQGDTKESEREAEG